MVSNEEIRRRLAEKKEESISAENTKIESKMAFCPNCGIKNDDQNKFCSNCGTGLTTSNKNELNDSNSDDSLNNGWLLVGALFPIIGVIGGLYYAFKGKNGAWALVVISIIFWAIWAVIFSLV